MKNKRYQLWLKINLPLLVTILSANVQAQIEALTTEEEVPLEVPVERLKTGIKLKLYFSLRMAIAEMKRHLKIMCLNFLKTGFN